MLVRYYHVLRLRKEVDCHSYTPYIVKTYRTKEEAVAYIDNDTISLRVEGFIFYIQEAWGI